MKNCVLLFFVLFFFVFQLQQAQSKDEPGSHTFRIIGETRGWFVSEQPKEVAVEYDPNSSNHLFISYFNDEGSVTSKKQFKFSGKKFYITGLLSYILKKELQLDGL